ncbi:MAG: HAMP domain-containing sensor histidine kinase, partial [Planctomycetota bacterium]
LVVPWIRAREVVDQAQLETSRQIVRLYQSDFLVEPATYELLLRGPESERLERNLMIRFYPAARWADEEGLTAFEREARELFAGDDPPNEAFESFADGGDRRYLYAARIIQDGAFNGVLTIDRRSAVASGQVFVNRVYLVLAGLLAATVAAVAFYFITTRIILSPVRALKRTADTVKDGDLSVRAEIETGDEFEELSDAFNAMLGAIVAQQTQLRGINRSLDLKLSELAERNVALYEAARVKGEFLANISHELRTPLNSIIGFAELLQEIADREDDTEDPAIKKRRRYLDNIVVAGRNLLVMINELLTMAKIDAGNVELQIAPMEVVDTCEGLLALIRPLADRKEIALRLQLDDGAGRMTDDPSRAHLPVVTTDAQKLQQVVFNFLSNAVKFTPEGGSVTLRAEMLRGADGEERLRMSVLDTGPGIPASKRAEIFEKFSQLETAHTKTHQGTGLGLAIAKEFAGMLSGEVTLESEEGRGSMFSVIVPREIEAPEPDAPDPLAALKR